MTLFEDMRPWLLKHGFLNPRSRPPVEVVPNCLARDVTAEAAEKVELRSEPLIAQKSASPFWVVGERLLAAGWISDIGYDRTCEWYVWTSLGKSRFADFITAYRDTFPDASQQEMEFINAEIYSLGIWEMSVWVSNIHALDEAFQRSGNVEICIRLHDGAEWTFAPGDLDQAADFVHAHLDQDRRVFTADNLERPERHLVTFLGKSMNGVRHGQW